MRTIHDLTKRVEDAHIKHLKEVKSLEEQTRNVSSATASPQPATTLALSDTPVSFESLVGGGDAKEKDMFGAMSSGNTLKPTSTSNTWSSQPMTPTSSNTKVNTTWSAPPPINNWNSTPKPINPIMSPQSMNNLNNGLHNLSTNNHSPTRMVTFVTTQQTNPNPITMHFKA